MDPIKEAFTRIKEDVLLLREELSNLRYQLAEIQTNQDTLSAQLDQQTDTQTYNQTHNPYSTPNIQSSTGNRGVPTDRQTHQQTHQQTQNVPRIGPISSHNQENLSSTGNFSAPQELSDPQNIPLNSSYNLVNNPIANSRPENRGPLEASSSSHNQENITPKDPVSEFAKANQILNSLDEVKREIRSQFKSLTPQEMAVFSHLYALEEQNIEEITYRTLAEKLSLSESSIRDYINKLIKKGVPIEKIKQNNKTILLKISQDLKNVATLATICKLREL